MRAALLGLLLTAPAPSAREPYGYQAARWGMSEAEVLALYPSATHVESTEVLEAAAVVAGRPARLSFAFFYPGAQLREVHLTLGEGTAACVADYFDVQGALLRKYGPVTSGELQLEGAPPTLPESPSAALVATHKPLSLRATWELGHTVIVHEGNCNGSVWGQRLNDVRYSAAAFKDHLPEESKRAPRSPAADINDGL